MLKIISALALFALTLASSLASAQTYSGYNVGVNESRRVIQLQEGVVLDILPLVIDQKASTEARSAGGVIGGLIGVALAASGRSDSWGKTAALGSIGALAGDAIARSAGDEKIESMQIVVRLTTGQTIAVAQEGAGEGLRQGDAVYVMFGSTTRVVRANAHAASTQPAAPTLVPSAGTGGSNHHTRPWPAPEALYGYQNAGATWPR